jgi:hypothetical protein
MGATVLRVISREIAEGSPDTPWEELRLLRAGRIIVNGGIRDKSRYQNNIGYNLTYLQCEKSIGCSLRIFVVGGVQI